jgi:hypothetical protein
MSGFRRVSAGRQGAYHHVARYWPLLGLTPVLILVVAQLAGAGGIQADACRTVSRASHLHIIGGVHVGARKSTHGLHRSRQV